MKCSTLLLLIHCFVDKAWVIANYTDNAIMTADVAGAVVVCCYWRVCCTWNWCCCVLLYCSLSITIDTAWWCCLLMLWCVFAARCGWCWYCFCYWSRCCCYFCVIGKINRKVWRPGVLVSNFIVCCQLQLLLCNVAICWCFVFLVLAVAGLVEEE